MGVSKEMRKAVVVFVWIKWCWIFGPALLPEKVDEINVYILSKDCVTEF